MASLDVQPWPGYEAQRFEIAGGDGEPSLLHQRFVVQRVAAPWFTANIGEWGPAWLVQVVEGDRKGLLLALTPRGGGGAPLDEIIPRSKEPDPDRWASLKSVPSVNLTDEQIRKMGMTRYEHGFASVVLHSLRAPGPGFRGDGSDTYAAGMTSIHEL